ncbi:hypothetical protein GCM10010207_38230 [Streptomyces atratus]|uniref:DUF7919 family protein n=1 Tax=Streptomyces atratus TaxID=1893 RepID=UPI00166F815B|nr:hypothetical protein [Streptomyces atratus]GGT34539.1 hypothetical protein GCM10010207_38230 [Streptomyces atratus]
MTTYSDLSPYVYAAETIPPGANALNIGWLGGDNDFPEGDVPEGFLDSFILLARDHSSARMRGWHACSLPHENGKPSYPYRAEADGAWIALGAAEVRVYSAGGELLIAPDLAYHYVKYHKYLPPQKFIEAVLARRISFGVN